MKQSYKPLVVANWKMNPGTLVEAKALLLAIKATAKKTPEAEVVVAAPAIFLTELQKVVGSIVHLAAQNVHGQPNGAFTGETSMAMLQASGVSHVIVGHSERRAMGETDEVVAKKIQVVLKAKNTPIVCIGERERDSQGNFYIHIESQIVSAFATIPPNRFKDIVIAYEPIWAIGTGKTATGDDVIEMSLYIHKVLTKHYGRNAAGKVRVIYGGSVNAENATSLYGTKSIAGFLVGGASLKPADFAKIIEATK